MSGSVSVLCPAKLNLYLRVIAREDSGYHQIETLFQAVDLCDELEVRPGGSGIALELRSAPAGPLGEVRDDLGDPERNTAMLAARAFFAATGHEPGVELTLRKTIPAGTGLGGASSDAAGALTALNALYGDPLDRPELLELGGAIGSDVPFFLAGGASVLAWGRGDRLLVRPPLPPSPVLLVVPDERSSTASAYRQLSARVALPAPPTVLGGAPLGGWRDLAAVQGNDFQRVVFERFPRLGAVRRSLAEAGAVVARMTGSGTALFGVFTDEARAATVAAYLIENVESVRVAVIRTLVTTPTPVSSPLDRFARLPTV